MAINTGKGKVDIYKKLGLTPPKEGSSGRGANAEFEDCQQGRVLCSPESFVHTCREHPEWGAKEVSSYFNQTKLWYYKMLGLRKVQELLREEQLKDECVMNPEIVSSATERFTSLLYTCVDELEVQVVNGQLDPLILVEVASLSTKVLALGDNIKEAQGVSLAPKAVEQETVTDKLLQTLKQRGDVSLEEINRFGVRGQDAMELKSTYVGSEEVDSGD